jgi:ABC-type nitrate/sulfonate/bicarbonate transport system substrate-binding protein
MNKILVIVLGLVVVGVGIFYYYDSQKINTVVVSSVDVPDIGFLFRVMQENGFDVKNKIKLELVNSEPGELERKLADRDEGIDVALFNPISMVRANDAKNIKLRAFSPLFYTYHSIIVKADSPYQTLDDLVGEKLALRPRETAAYNVVEIAMRVAGLSLEKDFQVTFTDIGGSIGLVGSGGAAATLVPLTATVNLVASGAFRAIDDLDGKWLKIADAPMPFINFAAHKDWLDSNPRTARNFRNMFLETAQFINDNPDVIDEYRDYLGIKSDEGLALMKERLPLLYPTVWDDSVHIVTLEKAAELGLINKVPAEYSYK